MSIIYLFLYFFLSKVRILPNFSVKKVASGANHIALLTQSGSLYTLGNSEQGQLGRVPEVFSFQGGRRGKMHFH
jgi:regulator of chromosome condensation